MVLEVIALYHLDYGIVRQCHVSLAASYTSSGDWGVLQALKRNVIRLRRKDCSLPSRAASTPILLLSYSTAKGLS